MSKLGMVGLVALVGGIIAAGITARPRITSYFVAQSTATPGASHAVELTWDVSPGVKSYNIYRSSTPTGTYKNIGATPAPPFFDFPVPAPFTFYYVVTAVSDKGESGYSDRVKASRP